MGFKDWFYAWVTSFFRILSRESKPITSESRRDRERRGKPKKALRRGKSSKKVRHSGNYGITKALCGFIATTLAILLLPFGLFRFGYKRVRLRNGARGAASRTGNTKMKHSSGRNKGSAAKPATPSLHAQTADEAEKAQAPNESAQDAQTASEVTAPTKPPSQSEDTPKSMPKSERDQYIKKRMTVADSAYCSYAILSRLTVGAYLELAEEPDNPLDKNAIAITCSGEKIGYVAKNDLMAIKINLMLRKNVYGVITDIITDGNQTQYEYEAWVDNN